MPRPLLALALVGLVMVLANPSSGALAPSPRDHPAPPSLAHPSTPLPSSLRPASTAAASRAEPGFAPATDGWLMYQGNDERDGVSADAAPVTSYGAWNATLPTGAFGSTPVTAGLVASGHLLYVASGDDDVYAYDQTNGTLAWAFASNGPLEATPVLYRGLLLVGSTGGEIDELNATTGAADGLIHLGGPDNTSSPLVVGNNVLAPCKARNLCAFNLTTGGEEWNTTVGPLAVSPSYDPTTGIVLVATTTGIIWALGSGGSKLWGYQVTGGAEISTSPIVGTVTGIAQRMVFAFATFSSGTSSELLAINETTMTYGGTPLYVEPIANVGISASAALTSTELVAPTLGGTLLAFDPANGAEVHPWNPDPWLGNTNPIAASLIDAQGTLLVGMEGTGTGGTGGGELAFISATTGDAVATLPAVSVADPIVSTPAIDSSAVFLADRDGYVEAVGPAIASAPRDLSVAPGNETLQVSWQAPSEDGGVPISYYEVQGVAETSGVPTVFNNVTSPTTSAPLPGLQNGVTYEVYVRANNSQGFGPAVSVAATPGARSYPPRAVAARVSNNFFHVSWQAPLPADTGGFAVTSYQVEYWNATTGPSHARNATGITATQWNAPGAVNGVEMFAQVAAGTSEGLSNFTGTVSGTPYLALGLLNLSVYPSTIWTSISITVQDVADDNYTSTNGTARIFVLPHDGTQSYWVNATAPGYLPFDEDVLVSSGNVSDVNVSLVQSGSTNVLLTPDEWDALTIGLAAALLIALFFVGIRSRRRATVGGGEEEEEDEEEGISESRARAMLAERPAASGATEEEEEEAAPVDDGVVHFSSNEEREEGSPMPSEEEEE